MCTLCLEPIHEHINPETATRIAHTVLDPRKGTLQGGA